MYLQMWMHPQYVSNRNSFKALKIESVRTLSLFTVNVYFCNIICCRDVIRDINGRRFNKIVIFIWDKSNYSL